MTITNEEWIRIQQMIDSRAETAINEAVAEAHHASRIKAFSEKELREIINDLKPQERFSAGKQFLLALLEHKGVDGLDRFMEIATASLLDDGKIEWSDFTPYERHLLKQTKPDLTRRRFLTQGAAFLGAGAIGKNIVKGLDAQLNGDLAPAESHAEAGAVQEAVHQGKEIVEAIEPVIETGVGSVVIAYAIKERVEERLQQAADAITALARATRDVHSFRAAAPGAWQR